MFPSWKQDLAGNRRAMRPRGPSTSSVGTRTPSATRPSRGWFFPTMAALLAGIALAQMMEPSEAHRVTLALGVISSSSPPGTG